MTKEANDGYKGHRAGSAKGKVHAVFDEKGRDAAIKKAVALEIKETTARTWCSAWGSTKKAKAPAKAKAATKASAKKSAPKTAKKKAAAKPAAKTTARASTTKTNSQGAAA